ncbi:hypothetical protein F2Q70_00000508 [Brassica cretica]|uniref:Uncharacterized protein n=1 Tax=Brassica cretica TaxID=69181 RepID=A0A8S9IPT5_BRACR|nr:hypothetical protein F2Q68_00018964 [Brassica cretica]KAF2571918.1 hypothetical protein F2Q70_00000508 [Brassica cretica]KAF3499474.1 hypothetical protein F2Q69_00040036 [Brassica cretica]
MVSVSRPFNITTKCASQLIGGNDFVRSGTASASRPISAPSLPPLDVTAQVSTLTSQLSNLSA